MLEKAAAEAQIRLPVHLKIDTGMGCSVDEAPMLARQISASASLEYAGTAAHLAAADSPRPDDIAFTERQIFCFEQALEKIKAAGLHPGIVHAANSDGVILHPKAWFDMVRPGILLYGYKAADEAGLPLTPLRVKPVMELRTSVALVKKIKKGETVSYNKIWAAANDTTIAVLPVGYAWSRAFGSTAFTPAVAVK